LGIATPKTGAGSNITATNTIDADRRSTQDAADRDEKKRLDMRECSALNSAACDI
jgi:hypothetical protein